MRDERGYLLLVTLFTITMLMAAGALLAVGLEHRAALLRQETRDVRLTALTDAGIAYALERLYLSQSWTGSVEQTLGDGRYGVAVGYGTTSMQRRVVATGVYWGAGRRVRAIVQLSDVDPPRVVAYEPATYDPRDPLNPP